MNITKTNTPTLAEHLAEYIVRESLDSLPAEVVNHAKLLFLDLLGAALAGCDTPEAIAAGKAVALLSPTGGPCTLWGTAVMASPTGAALHNGIIAHARELDDFGGVDHSGAVVVPVILAIAEAFPTVSGRQALEAMVVGYEVGRRVLDGAGGYRPHNHGDGFHSTGTCGSFAAAAAAAKAMGLNRQQTVWALGIAGSFTGGTWAFSVDGAMSKRFNVGRAAETGIVAATLARSGFTGPAHIFEAEWGGFLGTYARADLQPDALICPRPPGYGILRSGIKPYAACRDIHSSLDVILDAKSRYALTPADIAAIEVCCIPEMMQMIGKIEFPTTRIEAQLNLPYSIAVALVAGKAFLSEFEPPLLNDPEVKRLAGLIRLIESPDLPFDSEPYITLKTRDGRTITGHVDHASGAPQNPLPPDKIIEKFETLAQMALPRPEVERLRDKALALTSLADVREIAVCLRVAPFSLQVINNMQQPELAIELRQATSEDLEELVTIRIAAMRQSLEKVGRFDPQRARARLIQDFLPENTRCLVYDNRTIGFVISVLDQEEIALKHLYILPEFQNRGVGKSVLDQIIEQAKRERRNIRLITLKESRANDFYLKHGFKHVGSIEYDNVYVKKWSE